MKSHKGRYKAGSPQISPAPIITEYSILSIYNHRFEHRHYEAYYFHHSSLVKHSCSYCSIISRDCIQCGSYARSCRALYYDIQRHSPVSHPSGLQVQELLGSPRSNHCNMRSGIGPRRIRSVLWAVLGDEDSNMDRTDVINDALCFSSAAKELHKKPAECNGCY